MRLIKKIPDENQVLFFAGDMFMIAFIPSTIVVPVKIFLLTNILFEVNEDHILQVAALLLLCHEFNWAKPFTGQKIQSTRTQVYELSHCAILGKPYRQGQVEKCIFTAVSRCESYTRDQSLFASSFLWIFMYLLRLQ